MRNKIGIFDSGIGGLTVANSITKNLPNETIVYFGDTMHLPYGEKPKDLINEYSKIITNFLINDQECKCIVIACNTASAAAYEELRDMWKGIIPIINVIDPIIENIVEDSSINSVGLIGTIGTVNSGVYKEKLNRRKPEVDFHGLATPKLVPMIEDNYHEGKIDQTIINSYLNDKTLENIDTLILGCTHYPLIKNQIGSYYQSIDKNVKLIDSIKIVAGKLKNILEKENLIAKEKSEDNIYFVSKYSDTFEKTAKQFFGSDIKLIENNIFE